MELSVGELAGLAGVSVRTLHHYDAVGLLRPTGRTRSGHRRYGPADVERLQRIMAYRALGFELGAIAGILSDPESDDLAHLRRQRALLQERRDQVEGMLRAVEAMMEAKRTGVHLSAEEVREVFGAFDPAEYADEAAERWGETEAYRASRRRTAAYGKAEWLAIKAEAEEIEEAFASLLRQGEAPGSPAAMELAERHRQHIARWFYDCGPDVHRGLAGLYRSDPRFSRHYEQRAAGLAEFVSAAVLANAERQTG